jgi:hypothetical protein
VREKEGGKGVRKKEGGRELSLFGDTHGNLSRSSANLSWVIRKLHLLGCDFGDPGEQPGDGDELAGIFVEVQIRTINRLTFVLPK